MRLSFTGREQGWMMKTSWSRTTSSMITCVSLSLRCVVVQRPNGVFRICATASASGRFADPAKMRKG